MTYQVEDRGDTATIRGTGSVYEVYPEQAIPVEVTVECLAVEPAGRTPVRPTPDPTPVRLGSPAPGASTFHVEIGSGPHAGAYDVWTIDDACVHAEDGSWIARYLDRSTAPAMVALVAAPDELDGTMVGLVEVGFRSDTGTDSYVDAAPLIEVTEVPSAARLAASSRSARGRSWTDEAPPELIELAVTIDCPLAGR
jgi:hypothetical protein